MLAALQTHHPVRSVGALDDIAGRGGIPLAVLERALKQGPKDLGEASFSMLRTWMPKEVSAILKPNLYLAVGATGDPSINASTRKAADGGWVITLNEGLTFTLYEVARAFSLRVDYTDGSMPPPPTDPALVPEPIAEMIRYRLGFNRMGGYDVEVDAPLGLR